MEGGGVGGVAELLDSVKTLLWGSSVNNELFHRWSQGFVFSGEEGTALVQREGGPCAVIAPVQAFLFRAILRDGALNRNSQWREMPSDRVDSYLCQALTEILHLVATAEDPPLENAPPPLLKSPNPPPESTSPHPPTPQNTKNTKKVPGYTLVFLNQPLSRRISSEEDSDNAPLTTQTTTPQHPATTTQTTGRKSEEELFHRRLRLLRLDNLNQVESALKEKLDVFKGHYGILQFLYSVILTKGVSVLSGEMGEASELIDPVHGHGGQALINLLLSGRGVSYVWDNDKDLGGLQLKGIGRPCEVGFLTLLEKLRYCEVGSFLKNPKYPVWLLGSETHLTVLFSWDDKLVAPESPGEVARRVFQTFDPEGNNFIQSVLLEDLMRTLELFADSEYVELMVKKLDPEGLGVILLNDFLEEFYQNDRYGGPDTFTLFHYNGLQRSGNVMYREGNAILLESDVRCVSEENLLLTCLQTKWPHIDVQWIGPGSPSIN